jgi:CrcB protein
LVLGIAEERGSMPNELRLLLVTGFLGAYTTFSAFGWESYSLFRTDDLGRALVNVGASVVLGLLAVWFGATLARAA